MADENEEIFSYDEADTFTALFDINVREAQTIRNSIENVFETTHTDQKGLYSAIKPIITNAEEYFSNVANDIEKDSRVIDPCVSAGFYLNEIMWDISMAKDMEKRLGDINIYDFKEFFNEFKYNLDRFAKHAERCSLKNKHEYGLIRRYID
jgi:hypothetical protein